MNQRDGNRTNAPTISKPHLGRSASSTVDMDEDTDDILEHSEMMRNEEHHIKMERMVSRRIEYWGIVNEYDIYAKLLGATYFPENNNRNDILGLIMVSKSSPSQQADFVKQMQKLFEKRIKKRLEMDLDEVIKFRIRFNFERFIRSNKREFESIVDNLIRKRLIEATSNYDLRQLCESLKEKNQTNQERLHSYTKELLVYKWPSFKEKDKPSELQVRKFF